MAANDSLVIQVSKVLLTTLEQIDDYFEYRCRSEEDQAFVHAVLGNMHQKIEKIRDETKTTGNSI